MYYENTSQVLHWFSECMEDVLCQSLCSWEASSKMGQFD